MATSDEKRTCNVVQLGDGSAEAWLREHDKQHENGRVHLGCCQAANILRVLFQHAPQVRADERHLRRLLCAHVAGSRAYMDDGEASDCSEQPHIDFLRDLPSQIEQALYDRAINRAALAANPQQITSETKGRSAWGEEP